MSKEYTAKVEIRNNRIYVTREITELKAPYTKLDFLSADERLILAATLFEDGKQSCSQCRTPLPTEYDFAKHYILSDVRYLNLGDCPRKRMGSYDGE